MLTYPIQVTVPVLEALNARETQVIVTPWQPIQKGDRVRLHWQAEGELPFVPHFDDLEVRRVIAGTKDNGVAVGFMVLELMLPPAGLIEHRTAAGAGAKG